MAARSVVDVNRMRVGQAGPTGRAMLARLTAFAYSYWDRSPSRALGNRGTYEFLLECARSNPEALDPAVVKEQVRPWGSARVTGRFYALLERGDGTVLVEEDPERTYPYHDGDGAPLGGRRPRVFLVLGMAQSLGEVCGVGAARDRAWRTRLSLPWAARRRSCTPHCCRGAEASCITA